MKYFSLFSGIGGFELGIAKAYVEIINGNKIGTIEKDSKKNDARRQRLESKKGKGTHDEKRQSLKLSDGNDDKRAFINFDSKRVYEDIAGKLLQDSATQALRKDLADSPIGSIGPACVGYSEIDKYAIKIYEKYFNHKNYGDVRKIDIGTLPDFDLLVGGFPCQSFSVAGKRKGFKDTRGTLFFEIARIVAAKKPRLLFLENVKGLLSHQQGRTFGTILATLDELGYDLQWEVLNSKDHGVPQNRERVFIIGHLRGTTRPKVFPVKTNDEGNREQHVSEQETSRGVRNMSDLKSRWRHTMRIRKLTPVECERLQGFPDGWTDGVSDTQRYKTLGNAVTVNAVQAVAKKLLNARACQK